MFGRNTDQAHYCLSLLGLCDSCCINRNGFYQTSLELTPRVPAHGWQMKSCDEEFQCLCMMTFWIKSKGESRFVTVHKLVDCQGSALCGMVHSL